MELIPEPISIYISIGLVSLLVFVWCISICCCKGPCGDFKTPIASTFEAHLSPALRNSSIKTKYDHYYYRLLGGVRPPAVPSSRDQVRATSSEVSPYLVPTPLAGLKSDQIPTRTRSYDNEDRSCSVESVYSQDATQVSKETQDIHPIPMIMVTSGTSSENANGTDHSPRSSDGQEERKTEASSETESAA